jgi:hypothetical protein
VVALATARARARLNHFIVVPAQAGTQGKRRAGCSWVPAFARFRGDDEDECDLPSWTALSLRR